MMHGEMHGKNRMMRGDLENPRRRTMRMMMGSADEGSGSGHEAYGGKARGRMMGGKMPEGYGGSRKRVGRVRALRGLLTGGGASGD